MSEKQPRKYFQIAKKETSLEDDVGNLLLGFILTLGISFINTHKWYLATTCGMYLTMFESQTITNDKDITLCTRNVLLATALA